jgi:hypothetical protein
VFGNTKPTDGNGLEPARPIHRRRLIGFPAAGSKARCDCFDLSDRGVLSLMHPGSRTIRRSYVGTAIPLGEFRNAPRRPAPGRHADALGHPADVTQRTLPQAGVSARCGPDRFSVICPPRLLSGWQTDRILRSRT